MRNHPRSKARDMEVSARSKTPRIMQENMSDKGQPGRGANSTIEKKSYGKIPNKK